MTNMPDTFSINDACLQISPFETVTSCFWAIPRNKIGKHAQENIFLIKIPKILRVFVQDVPYDLKGTVLWKSRLVNDLLMSVTYTKPVVNAN